MTARFKIIWLIVLCFFLVSCSGYHQTGMPFSCDPGQDTNEPDDGDIKPGDKVRVTVTSGESVIGTIISCNNTVMTIDEQKIVGTDIDGWDITIPSRHVLFVADVQTIEVYRSNKTGNLLIGLGVIVVFIGAMVAKSLHDSFEGGLFSSGSR